jgi:hypothetical protein
MVAVVVPNKKIAAKNGWISLIARSRPGVTVWLSCADGNCPIPCNSSGAAVEPGPAGLFQIAGIPGCRQNYDRVDTRLALDRAKAHFSLTLTKHCQ